LAIANIASRRRASAISLDNLVTAKMDELQIADAMTEIFNVLRLSNKYIDETTPWVLAKEDDKHDRLETVIYNLLESIRICGALLEAFMPDTSAEILRQINFEGLEGESEYFEK
jgi:methionyl-tRNA synthetase